MLNISNDDEHTKHWYLKKRSLEIWKYNQPKVTPYWAQDVLLTKEKQRTNNTYNLNIILITTNIMQIYIIPISIYNIPLDNSKITDERNKQWDNN